MLPMFIPMNTPPTAGKQKTPPRTDRELNTQWQDSSDPQEKMQIKQEAARRSRIARVQKKKDTFQGRVGRAIGGANSFQTPFDRFTPEMATDSAKLQGYNMPPSVFESYLPPQAQAERAAGRLAVKTEDQFMGDTDRAADAAESARLGSQYRVNEQEAISAGGLAKEQEKTTRETGIAEIVSKTTTDVADIAGKTQKEVTEIEVEGKKGLEQIKGKNITTAIEVQGNVTEGLHALDSSLRIEEGKENVINTKKINQQVNDLAVNLEKSRTENIKELKVLYQGLGELTDASTYYRDLGKMDKVAEIDKQKMAMIQDHQDKMLGKEDTLSELRAQQDHLRSRGLMEDVNRFNKEIILLEKDIAESGAKLAGQLDEVRRQQEHDNQMEQGEQIGDIQTGLAEGQYGENERAFLREQTIPPTQQELLESDMAKFAQEDVYKKRVYRNAGIENLDMVNESISEVVGDRGNAGFAWMGGKARLAQVESVINVYNSLVSDPKMGDEFRRQFEANPEWATFLSKTDKWRDDEFHYSDTIKQAVVTGGLSPIPIPGGRFDRWGSTRGAGSKLPKISQGNTPPQVR